jgi:UDP-glucuronate decarboxylase
MEAAGCRCAGHPHRLEGVQEPELQRAEEALRQPVIFDGRNLYEPEIRQQGSTTWPSAAEHRQEEHIMRVYNTQRRILVTGGAGFLGSHLCERLLAQGHEVLCVDNFFTGTRRNVEHLLGNPRFELMRHDVTFPLYVEVDQIYNLACPASPVHYQHDPVQTTKTSVHGAINMLGLAKRVRARILQASTSEVYGDPDVHPQPESYWGKVNPIGVRSCYDEGKRCAETLFFDYHRQHGVDIRVARIFNTYGPRMHPRDGRVVSNFIVQALRGDPITIYGDGLQTRSFCFVDDLVEGLLRFMEAEPARPGPVNIGNPVEFTVRELAEQVIRLTGSTSKLTFAPLPSDDPMQRRPDIRLAKEMFGWQPQRAAGGGPAQDHRLLSTACSRPASCRRLSARAGAKGAVVPAAATGGDGARAAGRIAPHHPRAELGELLGQLRRAGVVRRDAAVLGREAEGERHVEVFERAHLAVEPALGIGPEAVGPAEARCAGAHAQLFNQRTASSSRWSSKWNHWQMPNSGV